MRLFSSSRLGFIATNFLLIGFMSCSILSSCYVTKRSTYFQTLSRDTTFSGLVTNNFESKIQKKDILGITISSLSKEMDERFNTTGSSSSGKIEGGPSINSGYYVDEQGTILVHHLGKIVVEGFTRRQLQDKLETNLLPFMKEPIVSVKYLNHKVTVLGEIGTPQVLNMPEEQLSLIDVIVASGDVKENANRKDIMLIREEGNEKQVKHLDLENSSIFSSPYYYVRPNDIIYVLPENQKYVKEEKRKNIQTTLSLIASGVSLLIIILNTFLK